MVSGLARRTYQALRLTPQRLLHPIRRGAALGRHSGLGQFERVLILCHGNICRSPYAEAKLRALLHLHGRQDVFVESAGFIGPGRTANDTALSVARARQLDLSPHRSRLVDRAMVDEAAIILVMTAGQASSLHRDFGPTGSIVEVLGDLDPQSVWQRDIPDPYGEAPEVFERVFDRIDRCLATLVEAWQR